MNGLWRSLILLKPLLRVIMKREIYKLFLENYAWLQHYEKNTISIPSRNVYLTS